MQFKISYDLKKTPQTIIIPFAKSAGLSKTLASFAKKEGIPSNIIGQFTGDAKTSLLVSGKTAEIIYLVGLGETPNFADVVAVFRSFAFRQKSKIAHQIGVSFLHGNDPGTSEMSVWVEGTVNGLRLGTYDIGLFKTKKNEKHPFDKKGARLSIYCGKKYQKVIRDAVEKGAATAETQLNIFDLVNAPGNKVIPATLAKFAQSSGRKHGYKVSVFNKAKIKNLGLDALLAVNRGSEYAPAFIVMEYKPKGRLASKLRRIGIVGKGVTFDTGGLSIKGATNMHYMKSDMGGAAAVLGAMEVVAKLQLPVHLIGIVPATDNCVDAKAVKPGDVISSYSGKTIEIIDTDAEGRLILADGLAYMEKHFKPDIMIDLATLTGSAVRTLGYQAGALFSKNDKLANQLTKTGDRIGERVWRLPLWDAYRKDIESDVADVRNFSGRPLAGAISAAKFLEFFTNDHTSWAHLDIAGVAFGDSEFSKQKSATAFGINLLTEFIKDISIK